MFKKHLIHITAAAVTVFSLIGNAFSAYATTIDDVAEVARSYGYSEDLIQQGYNKYYENPKLYDSDDFDMAIERLHEAGHQLVTTGPQDPQITTQPPSDTTTTSATTSIIVTTDINGSTVTQIVTSPPEEKNDHSGEIVLTMPDGSTFTRMSTADFIKLTYDQKMAI